MPTPLQCSLPQGWMNQAEIDLLYRLGVATNSIIELGSWVGRSTCAIAHGIRESSPTRFDVIDYGIVGEKDWARRFGPNSFQSGFNAVNEPGGSGAKLMQNLADRDLLRFVSLIIFGDLLLFQTTLKYEAAFADVLHNLAEISANMPHIRKLLDKEFILIADDIHNDSSAKECAKYLGEVNYWIMSQHVPYSKLAVFWTPGKQEAAHYIINGHHPEN